MTRSPISRFRNKRWAPERERMEEKRMYALVAMEVPREEEIKASILEPRTVNENADNCHRSSANA